MKLFKNILKDRATKNTFPWIHLEDQNTLDKLISDSFVKPVLIFKHSIRCGTSSFVKGRFEIEWDIDHSFVQTYFLDLITYRQISNAIAEKLHVLHESPQVILVKDGKAIYHASHSGIDVDEIKSVLKV